MSAFVKQAALSLHSRAWHILQVRFILPAAASSTVDKILQIVETGDPGVFTMWVLLDNSAELHRMRLVVERVFYLNQRQRSLNASAARPNGESFLSSKMKLIINLIRSIR